MPTNLEQLLELTWTDKIWKEKRDKAKVPGKLTKEVSMTDSFQAVHSAAKKPDKIVGALIALDKGISTYLVALKSHDSKSALIKSLENQQIAAVNLISGLRVAYAMVGSIADEVAEMVAIFTEFETTQKDAKAKPADKKTKRDDFARAVEWFGERVRGNLGLALSDDTAVKSIGNRLVQLGQGFGSVPDGTAVDVSGFKPIMADLEKAMKDIKKIKDADKIVKEIKEAEKAAKTARYAGAAKITKPLPPRMVKWTNVWT